METTEEHKVLRPIKRAKVHKSHTVTEKGPSHVEKMVLPILLAWRARTKIRDAPVEKRRESEVQRSSTQNWDANSLVFLSAVLRENLSSFRSTLHNVSHIMFLNVWNWSLLRSEGKVQNWVRRWSHYLNLCEAHGLNTWGQLPHVMNNGRNFSPMRRTWCTSLSRVLSTRSPCSASPSSQTTLSQDYENFIMCPATIRSENMSEQAQGDLSQAQSQDDEQALGNPLPPELPWGKV